MRGLDRSSGALRLVALVIGLAACGGGGGEPTQNTPTVASVTVSPTGQTLAPTETVQLTAAVKDGSGNPMTGRTVTWTTSANDKASVSAAGLVTAVAPGSATITATADGKSGSAQITVTAPVASVAVSASSTTLVPQQTLQLSVVLKDQAGTTLSGRTVTWASSSPTSATVSNAGLVTALALGTTTITATSEGKSGTLALTVATGAVVGSSGGTVSVDNGAVTVIVPAGAVSGNTPISITPVAGSVAEPTNASLTGTAYQIGPAGLTFTQPVTIKMKYDVAALPRWSMTGDYAVMVNNGTGWTSLGGVAVDTAARTIAGTTLSLGSLARPIPTFARSALGGTEAVAQLQAATPAVTTIAVNWASVTLTPAVDSVNPQKRSVMIHAGLVPTGVATTMPAPPGITQPTALWRYRFRTTGQNGTLAGGTFDTGWIDSPDIQYICTNANLDVVSGAMDDVIVDVLLNPGTENTPALQKIARRQMTVYAGLKKTYEIFPDLKTIAAGATQQLRFIVRDGAGNILPTQPNNVFSWKNTDIAGKIAPSQTEFANYTGNNTFTSPPPRVDQVDAQVQGTVTVVERSTHWDFSHIPPQLVTDRTVNTIYTLNGAAKTFVTVHVDYTVTLSPANPTVQLGGQPQTLQAVLSPAYNGPGLAYVWSAPGTHGTLNQTNGNHSASKSATYTPKALDPGGVDQVSVKVVSWVANTELETLGTGTASVTVDPNRPASFSARQIAINGGASWFSTATLEIPKVTGANTYVVTGTVLGAPYTRTFTGATSTNTQTLNQVLDGGNVWYINLDGGYNTIKSSADQRYQMYLTQYAGSTAKYKAAP